MKGRTKLIEATRIQNEIENNRDLYLDFLFQLLRQPSISSQDFGVTECADLLVSIMNESGIETRKIETDGHPIVFGEVIKPENRFTILFYGHYDVQPPDPLEKWVSLPFEPTIRNGKIYARGVGDNKGQLMAQVLAVKTLLSLFGELPVNVKMVFDGEEESSSKNFQPFVEQHLDLLGADLVYTSDGPLDSSGSPMILLGCRGMVYLELTAMGATHDNHSGNKGGIAPNPAWTLIHLLAAMRSEDGKVLVDGFYNNVRRPTEYELSLLRKLPFNPTEVAEVIGLTDVSVDGETYYRRLSMEPTFNISGLVSGYIGEGQKTIIPSTATVKLDIRLVADQDPEEIYLKIKEFANANAPEVKVTLLGSVKPSRTLVHLEVVNTVIESVGKSFGKEPLVLPAIGATFPGYVFTDILKLPSILVPYANADENNHAPNENMDIDCFFQGILTSCMVLLDLGEKLKK
jgi:acetylornithine deacetylase/succinyl-diaminopimelate desuccinylase-like protein